MSICGALGVQDVSNLGRARHSVCPCVNVGWQGAHLVRARERVCVSPSDSQEESFAFLPFSFFSFSFQSQGGSEHFCVALPNRHCADLL